MIKRMNKKGVRFQCLFLFVLWPILDDFELPSELKVLLLIVVDEAGDGFVLAPKEHSRGGFFFMELLNVGLLVLGVGSVASNHFRVLGNPNTLSLDDLNIVQATKNLVLDLELGAHGEFDSLLDLETLLKFFSVFLVLELESNGRTAGRVHGESDDNADSGVRGIGDVLATAEAKGLLVSLEGLITGIHLVVLGQALLRLGELVALSLLGHGIIIVRSHYNVGGVENRPEKEQTKGRRSR